MWAGLGLGEKQLGETAAAAHEEAEQRLGGEREETSRRAVREVGRMRHNASAWRER